MPCIRRLSSDIEFRVARSNRHGAFLSGLIVMFAVGYLSTPFFRLLPSEFKDVLVGVIFLAGAIFVLIVIKLYYKIIEDIGLWVLCQKKWQTT